MGLFLQDLTFAKSSTGFGWSGRGRDYMSGLPDGGRQIKAPTPACEADLFQHHFHAVDVIYNAFGEDGLLRLRDHVSNMKIFSLFSGLGGAELMAQSLYIAVARKCQELNWAPPSRPECLVCCEVDSTCQKILMNHRHPARHLIPNMLEFLTPASITRCRSLCKSAVAERQKREAKMDKLKHKLKLLKEKEHKEKTCLGPKLGLGLGLTLTLTDLIFVWTLYLTAGVYSTVVQYSECLHSSDSSVSSVYS